MPGRFEHVKTAHARATPLALSCVAALLAVAGCGSSSEQQSTAAAADMKAQVTQVCRNASASFDQLSLPTSQDEAVKVQRQAAQIFKNATGKLNELKTNTDLPADYKSWIGAYGQLSGLNSKAAEAFKKSGITSDQAIQAGQEWEAQAGKANDLARQAGLTGCVVGKSKS